MRPTHHDLPLLPFGHQKCANSTDELEMKNKVRGTHPTLAHFKDEEQVMKQYDYPYYTIHQVEHLTYLEKLKEFRKKYQPNQENNLHLVLEIQKEMVDWLIRHIGDSDRQLGIFLKEKLKV